MEYPKLKRHQITAPTIELDWNKLGARDFVVVSKEHHGSVRHFFGQVDWVEKLRNCHMLHIDVWEVWGDGEDAYEYNAHQVNEFSTGDRSDVLPAKANWKKPKGTVVRVWNPANQTGYKDRNHVDRKPRYGGLANAMPSDKTFERMGNPVDDNDLDSKLKARAGKRTAYVAARNLMRVFRDEMSEAFEMLGLTYDSTLDDFKKVQRTVMKQWHPDKEPVFVSNGGSTATFKVESDKWMAALSRVKHALTPKQVSVET